MIKIDPAEKVASAYSKAADSLDKVYGRPQSGSPVELYNTLKPQDFPQIAVKFGVQNTVNYIQTMEHQRLKGG